MAGRQVTQCHRFTALQTVLAGTTALHRYYKRHGPSREELSYSVGLRLRYQDTGPCRLLLTCADVVFCVTLVRRTVDITQKVE